MKKINSETYEWFQSRAEKDPYLNLAARVMGWFAISAEVFLRRDFGERHFNTSKFIVGLMMLGVFYLSNVLGIGNSLGGRTEEDQQSGISSMFVVIILYIILSMYHMVAIWWRNASNRPLFSYDHGLTWLEPVGKVVLMLPNFFISMGVNLYGLTLPEEQRKLLPDALPLLRDARSFTEKVIEPFVLLFLSGTALSLGLSSISMWLFVSAPALMFFTTIRHEMQRNSILDWRDQIIEARNMQEAMTGDTESLRVPYDTKQVISQMAAQMEESPEAMQSIRSSSPTIAAAMEALNPKLKGMAGIPTVTPVKPSESPVEEKVVLTQEPTVQKPLMRFSNPSSESPVTEPPPPPIIAETPPPIASSDSDIDPADWITNNSKALLTALVSISVIFVLYFVITSLFNTPPTSAISSSNTTEAPDISQRQETPPPAVNQPEERETFVPAPREATPPPQSDDSPAGFSLGVIQTEKGGNVNLRALPSGDAEPIMKIPSGAEVLIFKYGEETELKGERGKWCRVGYNGESGWIWGKYIQEK